MGLLPLKDKTGFLGRSRRSIGELQDLGRLATEAGLQTFTRLAGNQVTTKAPRVALVPRDHAGIVVAGGPYAIAARFPFSGSGPGVVATYFDEPNALRLVELLLGQQKETVKRLGELEESAIAEMTNIVLNGAITAVAQSDGLHFETGVPEVARRVKDLSGLLAFTAGPEYDHAVVVETPFEEKTRGIHGSLVLVFGIKRLDE
jgi:chemotaxis protein CheY-P-specific phosphatase CheC